MSITLFKYAIRIFKSVTIHILKNHESATKGFFLKVFKGLLQKYCRTTVQLLNGIIHPLHIPSQKSLAGLTGKKVAAALAKEANLARDPGSSTHCIDLPLEKATLKLDIRTWNVVRFHSSIMGSSSTIVQGCALG